MQIQNSRLGRAARAWLMMLIVPAIIAFATSNIFGGVSGHCCSCPECGEECCPQPTTIKEKKHCWEVECKNICIPAIKWWWQDCCELPMCGRVRTIKTLKKVEYECEKCGYKWEAPQSCKCEN
jgi:hypothetical protein